MTRLCLIGLLLLLLCNCNQDETNDGGLVADLFPPYNLHSITGDGSVDLVFDLLQSKNEDDFCGVDVYLAEGKMLEFTGESPFRELESFVDAAGKAIFDADPDDDVFVTPYFSLDYDALTVAGYWVPVNGARWGVENLDNGVTYTFAMTAYDCETGRRSAVSNIIIDTPCETVSPSPATAASGQWIDVENLQVIDCSDPWSCPADLQITADTSGWLQLSSFSGAGVLIAGAWIDFAESSMAPESGYQSQAMMWAGQGMSLFIKTRNGFFGRIEIESYDSLSGVLSFEMRVQTSEVDPRQL